MRRPFLAVTAGLCAALLLGLWWQRDPLPPPNVVVLVWDTVRADRMSLYGHDKPTTPHLDARADQMRIYDRAISPAVWTLPAHASLFTGLHVSKHGAVDTHRWLDSPFTTFAEALQEAGWDTYAFSANPFVSNKNQLLQGFDEVEHPWNPQLKRRAKRLHKEDRPDEPTSDPHGRKFGAWSFHTMGELARKRVQSFLDARDSETEAPFLIFINYMEAHAPRVPSMEDRRAVADEALVQRTLEVDRHPVKHSEWLLDLHEYSEEDFDAMRAAYDASIRELDRTTGALIQDLEDRGLLDDTVIFLVADHGEAIGEDEVIGHQFHAYRTVTHVPYVVLGPGRVPPGRVAEPTSSLRLFHDVLDVAGLPNPLGTRSFTPVTEYAGPMHGVMAKFHEHNPAYDLSDYKRSVRALETDALQFIRWSDGTQETFSADPSRTPSPKDVRHARKELETWVRQTEVYAPVEKPKRKNRGGGVPEGALEALGYVE